MKIDKDEKYDLEFKQNWRDEYLKWICAFANTHGGSLYIGVKDNGGICGVKNYRKLSEDIPNKIFAYSRREFWRSGGGMPSEQAIS